MPKAYFVFLDITIGTKVSGRVVLELFNDVAPKTVENFRGLCTGEYGNSQKKKIPLSYKGCSIFNVVPGLYIKSGDIEFNTGEGGESIYGSTFQNESFIRRHCHAGVLSMANHGRNTNNSQFLITLKKAPQLDGKHTVFGRVVEGMDVVRGIEKCPIDSNNTPRVPILIVECGQIHKTPKRVKQPALKSLRDSVQLLMSSIQGEDTEETTEAVKTKEKILSDLSIQQSDEQTNLERIRTALLSRKNIESSETPETHEDTLNSQQNDNEASSTSSDESDDSLLDDTSTEQLSKLQQLRQKLNESQKLNAFEVSEEAKSIVEGKKVTQNNTQDGQDDTQELAAPKSKWKHHLKGGWNLNEPASVIQERDDKLQKKKKNAENAFGWNAMNIDAFYRAHKKRTTNLQVRTDDYAQQMLDLGEAFYNPTSTLVSTSFKATPEAKERLATSIEKAKEKRKSFRRRRMFIEEETVQHINDFNRSFNQKLQRAYGAHSLEIQQNLERGTAL